MTREKCIFTDNDYIKEFLFLFLFISLSSNLKLSIDIFIMSVRHANTCLTDMINIYLSVHFCEMLLFRIKARHFVDIVSAQT